MALSDDLLLPTRTNAETPGPWSVQPMGKTGYRVLGPESTRYRIVADVRRYGDAELAASAPALLAEVARLRSRVARLEGVLRQVEWGGGLVCDDNGKLWSTCPRCKQEIPDHAPDCALDAALRDAHE